jgi:hypothetical protein
MSQTDIALRAQQGRPHFNRRCGGLIARRGSLACILFSSIGPSVEVFSSVPPPKTGPSFQVSLDPTATMSRILLSVVVRVVPGLFLE